MEGIGFLMESFESTGTFEIRGRGQVFTVVSHLQDPRILRGQEVLIDGEKYLVTGVETYAIPNQMGRPMGLLVRDGGG